MQANARSVGGPAHPSPARERVSLGALFFGLAGGPAAWITQLVVNYGLASFTCYPRMQPASDVVSGWHDIWYGLLALNLAAIAVTLAATAISWRHWRATRAEHPGPAHHALEGGEGRTRFLALVGILAGFGFVAAVMLDTIVLFAVPQCLG